MSSARLIDNELVQKVTGIFTKLDEARRAGLAEIKAVQAARRAALEVERQRLERKYGPDHPRVLKIQQRQAYNRGFEGELELELERTQVQAPRFERDTWRVHGRVLDEKRTGVANLTVSLHDASGTWETQLGHVCTDARGYFVLTYRPPSAAEATRRATQPLTLTVSTSDGKVAQRASTPLYVRVGQIDHREMVLADMPVDCPPPQSPPDRPPPSDTWVVRGRVIDDKGQGLAGMFVNVYDADRFFDDRLGETETDAHGQYSFRYRTADFRDLFERQPDIYLKVLDRAGQTLYTTEDKIRYEAGHVEIVDITIR